MLNIFSLFSPNSDLSTIKLSLWKLTLAPELIAISFLPFTLFEYALRPARASAPAGSERTLVSSKISLTAAQTSSTLTVMTSSTHSLATSKLFFPT